MSAAPRLDPGRLRRSRAYRRFTLWTGIASTAVGVVLMLSLYLAGIGEFVRRGWEEVWSYSYPAIANRVRALGLRWEDFAAPS